MKINGTTIKIKTDFRPDTRLSLTWYKLSNGNWVATDRGYAQDTYDTEIRIYGTEATVNTVINLIEANRATTNVLTLTEFNSQEHIFGADLDYTGSITATAEVDPKVQKTWKGFEVTVKLHCLSPSFTGGSGSLPILRFINVGYEADADYTIKKYDSYERNYTYVDNSSDAGTFSGDLVFDDSEMIALRRYIATQRSATISIPNLFGVTYPFGRRTATYPCDVKIVAVEDKGMMTNVNLDRPRWAVRLTLAEVI